jgi:MoaA/NifB/PqqE/SkfB family radical SAM enzyme
MKSSKYVLRQAISGSYKLMFFEFARRSRRFIKLIPVRPIRAVVNVTHNCNSRCVTCSAWKEKSQDELTTSEWFDILCEIRALGISDLSFFGGEPLLRDDLSTVVRKAHDLRFDRIHLFTNGLLLTRERSIELIKNGITSVYVSLNGKEQSHDITRGIKGAYARTMEAIQSLVELRDSRFPQLEISVITMVMGVTVDYIPEMADMCLRYGIGLSLSPLDTSPPRQGTVPNDYMKISQRRLDYVIDEMHRMKRTSPSLIHDSHTSLEYVRNCFTKRNRIDVPCYLGYLLVFVGAHGEVFPGCWPLSAVGELRQTSLKQIIESKAYKERVHDMFLKKCPGCVCDYILNLYAHVPAVVEEMQWRLKLRSTIRR